MPNFILKPLSEDLLETLRQWRNENRFFFINNKYITCEKQKAWYQKYCQNSKDVVSVIFYNNEPVGVLSISIKKESIELGRVILGKKKYARKGIMGEALELILSEFAGKKIFLKVLKNNVFAIAFYQKHKFRITREDKNCYIMER